MVFVWDGITSGNDLKEPFRQVRHRLADAGRGGDWPVLLEILRLDRGLVNVWRPDGSAYYTPLHHAAYGGAQAAVVEELVDLGGWRTLRDARGERPVDIARRRGHAHLLYVLEPVIRRPVPAQTLEAIRHHFHAVICERAEALVRKSALRLPELEPLTEFDTSRFWFAVPGMYGGFSYDLRMAGPQTMLEIKSWSRVVDGSGLRHEVTSAGWRLVEEGFI